MKDEAPSLEALIEALESIETPTDDEGFVTTREIARQTGMNPKDVRAALRDLKEMGRLESRKVPRENIVGYMHPEPAYRLKADDSGSA